MNNNKEEVDISRKASPDNLSENAKELSKTLPPSERGDRFICRPFGHPQKDKFQIFIKDNVLKEIKELPAHSYSGVLLGKCNLQTKSPFIEILKQITIEDQFPSRAWTKIEEEISSHPTLSLIGWYHLDNSIKGKRKLSQNEIHIHQMHFSKRWQVALILNPYKDTLTFLGWEGCVNPKIIEFNGCIVFSEEEEKEGEVEEEVDIRLETPIEINPSCREDLPLKLSIRKWELSKDKLNIFIETEIFDETYYYTRSHWLCESGGILLGKYWQNENILYITKQIPALHTNTGRTHLTFTHETWNEINKERVKYPDLLVVGWYHSHPGLGIFLSHRDHFIQKEYFNNPWQVALVIDPIWKGYTFFGWKENQIVKYKSHKV